MSKNYPLIFIMPLFSSGISAWKESPGTLNIATSRFSIVSITSKVISATVDTVDKDIFFTSFRNIFYLLPSAHVLPLIFTLIFFLIKLTASSAPIFLLILSQSELIVPNIGFTVIAPSFSCFNYLNMAATTCYPIFWYPS